MGWEILTAKKMLAANPRHKIPKESQTGPVPWTEYRARKELLIPSKNLSNFSPGGRTGSTEQLREKSRAGRGICCRFARKTRCSSKPCAPQSLENAQRSGVFISTYQQERLNANLLFCLLTAAFRPVASQANAQLKQIFQGERSRAPLQLIPTPPEHLVSPSPSQHQQKKSTRRL